MLVLIGCAGADRSGADQSTGSDSSAQISQSEGTRVVALGDWDDVEAAVDVGLSAIEAASLAVDRSVPGQIIYDFVTIRDDEGQLTLRLLDVPADQPSIEIIASIGHVARPGQEQQLVRAIRSRLLQLHGVDTRPVR